VIKNEEVLKIQKSWADNIILLGSLKDKRSECEHQATKFIELHYAYEFTNVLFKPTKAKEHPFRFTKDATLSYFIGGNNDYPEDLGFALTPWKSIHFDNKKIIYEQERATSMGHYYFTDFTNTEIKAEVTFGYIRSGEGNLKINLHHSSIPYF